ncbi:PREDICTED: B3 domain-containing protein At5g24050-like [Erythranthe guttata]|uniref:B3 domain-containing protein At5g24050-like n=1 Tax=Erythranthe guttata TaxID=4155 RepID=UPI00064D8E37|nr:PREDICTED: B3 domain-containing protein At5g24050-like [Erythranthe guttata]|eukprot:XP_012846832.1 PREDICTED: B3 domain-containing protein At5g24050-like [Erythranthe guttata]
MTLIPFTRVRDHGFLTEEEAHFLTTRDRNNKMKFKDVTIIEPSLRREKVKLSRWDMNKGNGKKYVFQLLNKRKWRHVVERNRLEPGDVVQLWSFRIDQELHFALVKLPGSTIIFRRNELGMSSLVLN